MFESRFFIVTVGSVLFGACSGGRSAPPPAPVKEPPPVVEDARPAAPPAVEEVGPIRAASRQLVVGVTDGWDAATIELTRYEREPGGAWVRAGEPWPATLGHTGLAWGIGLHGQGAPDDRAGPTKREGDGKSPAGAFDITRAFGYAANAVDGAALPYTRATRKWRCVDDPESAHYTAVVDQTAVGDVDWKSAEYMKRRDGLYEWVIVIAHNPDAAVGAGSCIFFHVWGPDRGPTVGCTAMAKADIEAMLAWLDPAAQPVVVQLPREAYAALAPAWGLP